MKNFIRETNSAKPTTLQASGVRGMVPRAVKAKLAKKVTVPIYICEYNMSIDPNKEPNGVKACIISPING